MNLDMMALGTLRPTGLFTSAEAARRGVQRSELQRWKRARVVAAVNPSHYIDYERWQVLTSERQLALRSWALSTGFASNPVLSHRAAAELHRLPLPSTRTNESGRIHLTHDSPGRTISTSRYTIHWRYGPTQCAVPIDGMSVVAPVLAAFGVAELHGTTAGVVALDAALHTGIATADTASMWLGRLSRRPGKARLRRVVALADGLSESPLESRARLIIDALGYTFRPQVVLQTNDGHFVARVDGLIEELGVVVEVDGRIKYRDADGRGSVETVLSEKHRDSAIRDLGYGIVRLDHLMLGDPPKVDAYIQAAARRAKPQVCRRVA